MYKLTITVQNDRAAKKPIVTLDLWELEDCTGPAVGCSTDINPSQDEVIKRLEWCMRFIGCTVKDVIF